MTRDKKSTKRTFGNISATKYGRWRVQYSAPDGRHTAGQLFATRTEAEDWLDRERARMTLGSWRSPDAGAIKVSVFATEWLLGRDDLKPKTLGGYAYLMDRHIIPQLGSHQMSEMTPLVVRRWYAGLGQTTGKTVRAQAYRLLHTIMAEAVRAGVISLQPCNIVNGGHTKAAERQVLTPAEVDVVAASMPPRLRFVIVAAAWTGLRFGEISELRRKDVSITMADGQEVAAFSVTRSATVAAGKVVVGTPKTAAGRRTVTLPPHIVPALKAHLADYVADDAEALIFTGRHGGRLHESTMSELLKPGKELIGRPDMHFHDLRHTGATLAAQTGATLKELMTRLGHSTPGAAMIYQHAAQQRDVAIANAMSDLVRRAA